MPIPVPSSTRFSVCRERPFCPMVSVQNRLPSPAPGSRIWGRVKYWNSEILASWVASENVRFPGFQVFSFPPPVGTPRSCPARRTPRPVTAGNLVKSGSGASVPTSGPEWPALARFRCGHAPASGDALLWPGVAESSVRDKFGRHKITTRCASSSF